MNAENLPEVVAQSLPGLALQKGHGMVTGLTGRMGMMGPGTRKAYPF